MSDKQIQCWEGTNLATITNTIIESLPTQDFPKTDNTQNLREKKLSKGGTEVEAVLKLLAFCLSLQVMITI